MPSKVRLNFKFFCFIYVSKGVIWASEYSLGPQLWGQGGLGPQGPPGSATVQTHMHRPPHTQTHTYTHTHTHTHTHTQRHDENITSTA